MRGPSNSRIAVLILFFERPEQTIACVKSFLPADVSIYVWNNGSGAAATKEVHDFCAPYKRVTIWDSSRNLGVSGGRNALIQRTTEEWLFFADSDVIIQTTEWTDLLLARISQNLDIDAFIPKIFNSHESSYMKHFGFEIVDNELVTRKPSNQQVNLFPGTAAIVKRSLFDRIGIYDEAMFVGFEDYELGIRAQRLGMPIHGVCIDEILLRHDHRLAKSAPDRQAASTRFDHQQIEQSFEHMCKKHNIHWQHDWEWWVKKEQVRLSGQGWSSRIALSLFNLKEWIATHLKSKPTHKEGSEG